jgi:GTP cyclohydrolase I
LKHRKSPVGVVNVLHSEADSVYFYITCSRRHMCMVMRGVEKQGASTVTTALLGTFKSDPQVKREFYALLKLG